MPRPARLQFEGAFYHVYSRGNRRQRIFWTSTDYREFEELLWVPTMDRLIQVVWERFHVTEAQLRSTTKNRHISASRRALVYVAKRYARFSTTAIARRLGHKLSAISQMNRVQEGRLNDEMIEELLRAVSVNNS